MKYKILVLNLGSTSTKIAVYENETELIKTVLEHPAGEIAQFRAVADQFALRKKAIVEFLNDCRFDLKQFSAIAARGGILPPLKAGAYLVNEAMVDRLAKRPLLDHASNLGALIASEFASQLGINAYIYDAVSVDELDEVARISGMPDVPRRSFVHALNSRAVARQVAGNLQKKYTECTFIVAHLGGGISLSVHKNGRMIDIAADDEGPFSPERAGRVPCKDLIDLCFSGKYDYPTLSKKLRGKGGLLAYLGTSNAKEIEKRICNGDRQAELIYKAMGYQVAKGIGELSTVVHGKVDRIILTGGLAFSPMLINWIKERVEFIAPVELAAGENEMQALAQGVLRVLRGEEGVHEYWDFNVT